MENKVSEETLQALRESLVALSKTGSSHYSETALSITQALTDGLILSFVNNISFLILAYIVETYI